MSDDERAIRALAETWMSATKAGDMHTLRDLMTEDMLFMAPGVEPFGREAFLGAGLGDTQFDGHTEVLEVGVHGDCAYMRSFIEVSMTAPGKDAVRYAGYALGILRKGADGRWRLTRDANLVLPRG